jgi:hypothetical protein
MRTLLAQVDLKTILLIPVLLGYLIFRLLRFGIGPKSWTSWFWGESSEKKSMSAASQ